MTPEQEQHLAEVESETVSLIDFKYRAGQAKHGGNLFDLTAEQILDEAINEAIDQVVYLLTLKQKLNK